MSYPVLLACIALLLLVGLLAVIILLGLQLRISPRRSTTRYVAAEGERFLSLHLPTCAEPPDIVIATLKSILRQGYQNYEVLIVDNNTSDGKLWRPVEYFCRSHSRLRFVHREQLAGFKAGALNLARQLTHESASHLVTIDADYQLAPGALRHINDSIEAADARTALIQFPQAYRNAEGTGFQAEYRHFFDTYLADDRAGGRILGTGTLSCIRLAALDDCGGWPTTSITEDAALGLELAGRGWKGQFDNEVIGRGLVPVDVDTHYKQRIRWIYGNAQVLAQRLRSGTRSLPSLPHVLQLTAWLNPLAPTVSAHLLLLALLAAGFVAPPAYWFALLATYGIHIAGKFLLFYHTADYPAGKAGGSLLIHLNYLLAGAFCWWGVLWKRERPFLRSCKAGKDSQWTDLRWLFPCLLAFTAACFPLIGAVVGAMAFVLALLLFCSRLYFLDQVHRLRHRTAPHPARPIANQL